MVVMPVLMLAQSSAVSMAQDFEVKGTITQGLTNTQGKVMAYRENLFTVAVARDGRWRIETTPVRMVNIGREQPDLPGPTLYCSDLTNVYEVHEFLTNRPGKWLGLGKPQPGVPVNNGFATVARGGIPYGFSDPCMYYVWYAFASERYFRTNTDDYLYPPQPTDRPGEYSKDFRVHAHYELAPTEPRLPVFIQFTAYPRYRLQSDKQPRHDMFESTNLLFEVKSLTNVGGLTLPKEIVVQCYGFPVASNYFVVTPESYQFRITIDSARIVTAVTVSAPRIPDKTLICDLRPIAVDSPVGVVAGPRATWPREQASAIAYERLVRSHQQQVRSRKTHLLLSGTLIAALLLAPFCFVCYRWYSIHANKKPAPRPMLETWD